MFGWARVRVVLMAVALFALLAAAKWTGSYALLLLRLAAGGFAGLVMFGLFERWPHRLPNWLPRWVLQVASIGLAFPFIMALVYVLTTGEGPQPWYKHQERMAGYSMLTMFGVLFGPWIAAAALLRQIRDEASRLALALQLERSESERKELGSRMRLLQAQVEPHFLFNTLANVRELVDSGSPQASVVLEHLITYLRAAVPRLQSSGNTLAQEFDLVQAYLEVMRMRMPDRLQFELHLAADLRESACPPMAVLTLVENAIRHGIDPAVDGGRIDVRVERDGADCRIEVADTGVGQYPCEATGGTGLLNLRERLRLAFGESASLQLRNNVPRGVVAVIRWPLPDGLEKDHAR